VLKGKRSAVMALTLVITRVDDELFDMISATTNAQFLYRDLSDSNLRAPNSDNL
jgi:sarcosine oxidase gamma subunit